VNVVRADEAWAFIAATFQAQVTTVGQVVPLRRAEWERHWIGATVFEKRPSRCSRNGGCLSRATTTPTSSAAPAAIQGIANV
jgi:hypothetical protein